MDEALEQLQRGDTKDRLAGVERLQRLLEQSQKSLSEKEVMALVDASTVLLKDNNFKVCQGTLHLLTLAAVMSGEYLRVHYNQLVPAVVERLGDNKQTVRDASRRLLLALMEVSTPSIIADRAGSYAWTHKNWRVREEFAHTIASAFNLFSSTGFHFQRMHLPANLQLLEDSNSNVREAALVCLEEMYRHGGQNVKDELQRHHLRPALMKEISFRFDRIEPTKQLDNEHATTSGVGRSNHRNSCHSPVSPILHSNVETKVCHFGGNQRPHRRCSPKYKSMLSTDVHLGGGSGGNDKPVGPIKVFSERELTKELDKIVSLLKAEQEWSVRMAAMQKLEGIIVGGAVEFGCFLTLFKNFTGPLSGQLLDRRSSIVKQACQLLNLLSKQFQIDFESFAEVFIPVLFRSVVVTVLVIGESADHCIKTMLENCRVARVLPRIIECAKHDRNAILRTKCCNYALLVLEKWGDSPELHRISDLYQELIRCCTLDAVAEVRSNARACYQVYSKLWPDRARRVFSLLDPAVQKLYHDEEVNRRYLFSPAKDLGGDEFNQLRRSTRMSVHSVQTLKGETSNDRSKRLVPGSEPSTASNLLLRKSLDISSDIIPEKMLEASQLNAIDTTSKGVDSPEGVVYAPGRIAGGSYLEIHAPTPTGTMRVIADSPSARDPPHPASAPASCHCNALQFKVSGYSSFTGSSTTIPASAGLEDRKEEEHENNSLEIKSKILNATVGGASVGSPGANRVLSSTETPCYNVFEGSFMDREIKQNPILDVHIEKLRIADSSSSIGSLSHRISWRHTASGKSSECTSGGNIHQPGGLNPQAEMLNYMDGVMSLNDALTEGLGPNADWSARVAAFTYIQKLLQQGSKGSQEVAQNFDRMMKLFTTHLDDPHWRVTQAALSALIELVRTSRRMFEPYLERTLPSVFARLVDSKDSIRQLGLSALETIGDTYTIDTLLLPLLRSIDEQRIPKARMTVIEFAIAAFARLANDGSGTGSTGLLKLWLAKLAPLANDKNAKLREAAIAGIISVYSQFDPTIVLNFILGLSIEEQSMLRRSLKQFTPRIDLDLMAFLHNKVQRPRTKPVPDQTDATRGTVEESTGRALSALTGDDAEIRGSSI
ncbi:CLIP-associated protein isoform X1 [Physcomitrium patens]|uniref:TOG domain-containing protein n=1 Tax=Physcomitrium patens TaxID=3218 RepID=A0A2K1KWT0_PHYPA|nr:hypothetical protein PHYPA_005240 [Physcomitrium patens]